VFQDPGLQAAYERDGFVVVPFLDQAAVDDLWDLWTRIRPGAVQGIYSNVHDHSPEANWEVHRAILRHFGPPGDRLFDDCFLAGVSFLVKGTGEDSDSKLHQDWNNVDEDRSESLSIWCPLVDVDGRNGALQVVPGSHRLFRRVRGITIPSVYLELDEELDPYLVEVPVPAGTAVIYSHALFHGSKPNRSDEARVAAVSGVIPRGVPHVHYWRPPDGPPDEVRVLTVDPGFFYEGLPELYHGSVPDTARHVATITTATEPLSRAEVLAGFASAP